MQFIDEKLISSSSIYAQSDGKDTIEFEAFPSGARGNFGGHSWKTSLPEFEDFVLDTAQDLLVLVNVEYIAAYHTVIFRLTQTQASFTFRFRTYLRAFYRYQHWQHP
jgi:hypothetical protein